MTTVVAGRLHRQDLHLLEHQLASLQPLWVSSPVRERRDRIAHFRRGLRIPVKLYKIEALRAPFSEP
jgi:hypothetical protein